ncbi:MAG: hypothetical protein ACI364_06415, partial [Coriobacteriales bacterium]
MAVLVVVSLSPWADVASAYGGASATATAGTTQAKTVDVVLSLGNGSITVNGQTLTAPSSQIAVPTTKAFTFTASATTGYDLTSVNLTRGQDSTTLAPGARGVYTVAQDQLAPGVGIELVTEAQQTAAAASTTPTALVEGSAGSTTSATPSVLRASAVADADQTAVFPGVLGDAVNYGMTTGTFTLKGDDAETNVAAKVGTCTNQTGNDLSNPITQTMLIGEIDGSFGVKGYSVYFRTSPESADK